MTYHIKIVTAAQRDLKALARSKTVFQPLVHAINGLAKNPRPAGTKHIKGNIYRIRVGDYRIIYQVEDDVLLVLVLRAGHRREAYRNLPALLKSYLK